MTTRGSFPTDICTKILTVWSCSLTNSFICLFLVNTATTMLHNFVGFITALITLTSLCNITILLIFQLLQVYKTKQICQPPQLRCPEKSASQLLKYNFKEVITYFIWCTITKFFCVFFLGHFI